MKLIAGASMLGMASASLFGGNTGKFYAMNQSPTGGITNVMPFLLSDDKTPVESIPMMMAASGSKNPMLPLLFDEDFVTDDKFMDMMTIAPQMFTGYPGSTGMTQRMLPFLTGEFEDEDEVVPLIFSGAIEADSPYVVNSLLNQRTSGLTYRDHQLLGSLQGRPMATSGNPFLAQRYLKDADDVLTQKDFRLMNTIASGGDLTNDPFLFLNRDDEDDALSKGDYLVYSAGLKAGGLNNYMPYLLDDDTLATEDIELPLFTNMLAGGEKPSLSRHLIPAMQMTGADFNYDTIMPWMMTQGQSYLGYNGANPYLLDRTDLTTTSFLPWLAAGQAAPTHSANPFVAAETIPTRTYGTGLGYGAGYGRTYGTGLGYAGAQRFSHGLRNRLHHGAVHTAEEVVAAEVAEEVVVEEP